MINLKKYIGRDFDPNAWNCWALCQTILKDEAGVSVPPFVEYFDEIKNYKKLSELCDRELRYKQGWQGVPPGDEKTFDIVIMRIRALPIHVGMVVSPGAMLHVLEECGTVIEEYRRFKWKDRVLGFYRHKELEKK